MIDESVDERLQNSRRPEVDDSDESANFEKTLLAVRSMTNSMESAATVFDGEKNEAMDEIREKLKALKVFLRETVALWKETAPLGKTEETYDARDKLVFDVATIVAKTSQLSVDAVKAAAGTKAQKQSVQSMTALRAKTYKAVKGMPPLREPEEDEALPGEQTLEIWRELVESLAPGVEWIESGDDIPLGGDATAAAVNQAVDDANKKPPKGGMSAALSAAANGVTNLFSPARNTRSSGIPPTSGELPRRGAKQSTPAEGKKPPPELNLTGVAGWAEKAAAGSGEPLQPTADVKLTKDAADVDIEEAVRKEKEKVAAEKERTKEALKKVAAAEKRVEELKKQKEKEEEEKEAAKKEQEEKEKEAERKVREKGEEKQRLTAALKKLEKEEQEAKEEQRRVREEGRKQLQAVEMERRQEAEKTEMANRRLQQLADQDAELKKPSKKTKKSPEKAVQPTLSESVRNAAAAKNFNAEKTEMLAGRVGQLNDALIGGKRMAPKDVVEMAVADMEALEEKEAEEEEEGWNVVDADNRKSHRPSPPKSANKSSTSEPGHIMTAVGMMQAEWIAHRRMENLRPKEKFSQGKQNKYTAQKRLFMRAINAGSGLTAEDAWNELPHYFDGLAMKLVGRRSANESAEAAMEKAWRRLDRHFSQRKLTPKECLQDILDAGDIDKFDEQGHVELAINLEAEIDEAEALGTAAAFDEPTLLNEILFRKIRYFTEEFWGRIAREDAVPTFR